MAAYAEPSMSTGDQKLRANNKCQVRLDRISANAVAQDKAIKNLRGYKCLSDFRPQQQGRALNYGRVRKFCSVTNSSKVTLQYERRVPWGAPQRVTMIGHDQTGLSLQEIQGVISQCYRHDLSLVELAFDFTPEAGVDREFVLRHGRFGKSRRRLDRGGPGTLRYGGRSCPKLVRCYLKESLEVFRVELELHRSLLRKYGATTIHDLAAVAARLVPAHLRFVCVCWKKLKTYLVKKFGNDGNRIAEEARHQADLSLAKALRYLAKVGVPNPHRFLVPLKINRAVREALQRWAEDFAPDQGD
jgi:hypothetical protein